MRGCSKDPPHFQRRQAAHYYSLCESLRVAASGAAAPGAAFGRVEHTQLERWQRTIEVVEEDGRRHQMRLFSDRHGEPRAARHPRMWRGAALEPCGAAAAQLGGWVGCKLGTNSTRRVRQQALGEGSRCGGLRKWSNCSWSTGSLRRAANSPSTKNGSADGHVGG